jgi:hypothetical protein
MTWNGEEIEMRVDGHRATLTIARETAIAIGYPDVLSALSSSANRGHQCPNLPT